MFSRKLQQVFFGQIGRTGLTGLDVFVTDLRLTCRNPLTEATVRQRSL